MESKDTSFSYSLEQVRKDFLETLTLLNQFEVTFSSRAERALNNNKEGIFISINEFECTAELYHSIHAKLLTSFQIMVDSAKNEKTQTMILESMLADQFKADLQKKSA